ncbi:MAG: DUF5050 domain-containing protein [Firmicutes bacterium]|nr:DUF5050 domain-containing protein [Bacillota bacterium]
MNIRKILLMSVSMLLLVACTPQKPVELFSGNTSGNISNLGGSAYFNDTLYCQDNEEYFLVSRDKDGNKTKLNDIPSYFINTVSDGIYYCGGENFDIYKIDNEGNNIVIEEGPAYYLNVDQDYIYYVNYGDDQKIYRASHDGSNPVKLAEERASYLTYYAGRLYYVSESDNYRVISMKTDGTDQKTVVKDATYCLNIEDDYIYYVRPALNIGGEATGDNFIYRADINIGTPELVLSDPALDMNVSGDCIYYRSIHEDEADDTVNVYNIKTKKNTVLAEENGSYLTVSDNKLFYLYRDTEKNTATVKEIALN